MNQLVIGNKNYSSWSLRPWLLLREKGIAFTETIIPLYMDNSKEALLQYSPAGMVPVLLQGDITIWDSLAICEHIAESYPEKGCWPKDPTARAFARSISYEMHSGFFSIRNTLPMNCRQKMVFDNISPELASDIARICEIWRTCREQSGATGNYLFGAFSIADAMFAPIVLRFNSYGIKVGELEQQYMDSMLANGSVREWVEAGILEKEIIEMCEM